ncbi:DUF6702 family protein [Paucihalobacter sp.]|uniref:DUF6702 family protein n=1 Tax=Paucihalobacter sp. TaxID=2850405 RepID=UPI002FDFE3DD
MLKIKPFKGLTLFLFVITIPVLLSVVDLHKFYVSVTQIEYVKEKQSLQIITRVFLDDLEDALSERFGESIRIPSDEKNTSFDTQIEEYFMSKIDIAIDGKASKLNFVGKSMDIDVMVVYLEVKDVQSIKTIQIKNNTLFEIFEEQQNIIRTDINNLKKSFILISQDRSRMLNF